MKIAIIANNQHPVLINSAFGVESYCHTLTTGLVNKGHSVTLYASGDSKVPSTVISVHPIGTAFDKSITQEYQKQYQDWLYLKAYQQSNNYDIMLSNDPTRSLFYSFFSKTPTLSVIHSPWNEERYPIAILEALLKEDQNNWLLAISDYQRKEIAKNIKNVRLVYHGIDISQIKLYAESKNDYLLFLGRVNQRKGIHLAVDSSIATKKLLKIFGFIAKNEEMQFFEQVLLPKISENKNIEFSNSVIDTTKYNLLNEARAFLFPIQWEEPFGLVLIESMACGTPVIAFARGSVPEIIKDGETGYLINPSNDDIRGDWIIKKTGFDGLCEAIEKIYSLPEHEYRNMRKACRARVENHFTVERMIEDYEHVFNEIRKINL